MSVWRERMRAHADAAYVHVIVNEGKEAGASLPHTHAQLYALPFVPAAVARERERFTAYSDRTQGRNLLEDLVQEEVRRRERVVAIDDEAVAIAPFAARVPFHVLLAPRRPAARFADDGPLGGRLLHEVLNRLRADARDAAAAQHVGPDRAARRRDASAGGSRSCRGSPSSPGSRSAPACTSTCSRRRTPPSGCATPDAVGFPAARCRPSRDRCRCSPPSLRRSRCPTAAGARRSASSFAARRRDRHRRDRLVPGPHLGRAHLRAGHGAGRRRRRGVRLRLLHARARGRAGGATSAPPPTSPTRPRPRTPTGRSTSPTTRSATGAARRAGAA